MRNIEELSRKKRKLGGKGMMGMSNNWGIPDLSTFTENMIVNHLIFRLQKKLYYIYNMGIYIYTNAV